MRGTFAPFFKHSIYYLTEIVTASFIFEILIWLLGGKRKKQMKKPTKIKQKNDNNKAKFKQHISKWATKNNKSKHENIKIN